jgi:hypothetical protein
MVLYAICTYNKITEFVWPLADGMYDSFTESKNQADEWYDAINCKKEDWSLFVIESVEGLCQMTNEEQLELFKKALYVKG